MLAVTAECLPLAFFDLAAVLDGVEPGRTEQTLIRAELDVLAETESVKAAAAAEAIALLGETERLRAEFEQVKAESEQHMAESEQHMAESDRLRAENEHLGTESERLRASAAESDVLLADVLGSTSWRLTEPARRLMRRFRA